MAGVLSRVSNYSANVTTDYNKISNGKGKKAKQQCCQNNQDYNNKQAPDVYEKTPNGGFCACC